MGSSREARERRERKGREGKGIPSIIAPRSSGNFDDRGAPFPVFYGMNEDFHEDACYAESSSTPPLLPPTLFVRILFAVRGIRILFHSGWGEFSRVPLIPRSIKYQVVGDETFPRGERGYNCS